MNEEQKPPNIVFAAHNGLKLNITKLLHEFSEIYVGDQGLFIMTAVLHAAICDLEECLNKPIPFSPLQKRLICHRIDDWINSPETDTDNLKSILLGADWGYI